MTRVHVRRIRKPFDNSSLMIKLVESKDVVSKLVVYDSTFFVVLADLGAPTFTSRALKQKHLSKMC